MSNNIQRVVDTITEKPLTIRFGLLPVIARPLTLAQIYEIGALLENAESLDVSGQIQPVSMMLANLENIDLCAKVINVILFRNPMMRLLWGWYIKRHLTMTRYQQVIEYAAGCFGATFFLTSFTFLKGAKQMTKRTNTPEATPSGDSSEE